MADLANNVLVDVPVLETVQPAEGLVFSGEGRRPSEITNVCRGETGVGLVGQALRTAEVEDCCA